jgi:predicted ATPase/class 3 adenylate cyclase
VRSAPTGSLTFLFTDIEGSTPLWEAHPAAMRVALARHDAIMRDAIEGADGFVFNTSGDGFSAAFEQAANAVNAALFAQRGLRAEAWPEGVELKVRMGMYTGEAEERDGDYFGPPVIRAARLMGAAHGGQVVVSAATASMLDVAVLGVELVELGSVRLKGVVDSVRVVGVTTPELPWLDRPLVSSQSSSGNLPRPRTPFVGDVADLRHRVTASSASGLLTLTGVGGVGKTRAAIETGWLIRDEFPDGAWLVELGLIADPALVVPAVASALGVHPQPDLSLIESIVDWCQGRRLLLIIDNCEHVLEQAIDLVSALVSASSTVAVIATSREPLGVPAEQVVRVTSLGSADSIELFRDRSAAAGGHLDGTDEELDAIGGICRCLDGIPLAIELAAARTRTLSPPELLDRLDDRFRLLRGSGLGGIDRHQTLRATVSWSYRLLTDRQQRLFDRLSVFAGDFDLVSAEAVGADDESDELGVVELLAELVDKSMVVADRVGRTTRYRLLETLRQFGEERLDDRGTTAVVRDRHLQYFHRRCLVLEDQLWGPKSLDAAAEIEREWDNLRAAHSWAIATDAFDLAVDIVFGIQAYAAHSLRFEVAGWAEHTLSLGERLGAVDYRINGVGAWWAFHLAEPERGLQIASRMIDAAEQVEGDEHDLARAIAHSVHLYGLLLNGVETNAAVARMHELLAPTSDPRARYTCLTGLADVPHDADAMVDEARELVTLARQLGAPGLLAHAMRCQANTLVLSLSPPDIDGALTAFSDVIELAAEARSKLTEGWGRGTLAFTAMLGNHPDTVALTRDALVYANALHYPTMIECGLALAALCLATRAQHEAAATVLGHCERRDALYPAVDSLRSMAMTMVADHSNLDELRARGAVMTRLEIVAFADAALAEL